MPIRPVDPTKRGLTPVLRPAAISPGSIVARALPPVPAPAVEQPSAAASPATEPPARRAHHKVDRTGANWDENGDYIVGKGRPPVTTRWQKGQSGNPRGPKPSERLDPQAAFEKEVLTDFTAKVNGQDVTLNMGTFALQLIKTNAAKGNFRAQKELVSLYLAIVHKAVERDPTPEMEAWEQQVIDDLLEQQGLPARPVVRQTDRLAHSTGDEV